MGPAHKTSRSVLFCPFGVPPIRTSRQHCLSQLESMAGAQMLPSPCSPTLNHTRRSTLPSAINSKQPLLGRKRCGRATRICKQLCEELRRSQGPRQAGLERTIRAASGHQRSTCSGWRRKAATQPDQAALVWTDSSADRHQQRATALASSEAPSRSRSFDMLDRHTQSLEDGWKVSGIWLQPWRQTFLENK